MDFVIRRQQEDRSETRCQPYKDNYDIQCTENGVSSTMQFEVYAASDNEFGEWRCTQTGGNPSDTIDIQRLGNYIFN